MFLELALIAALESANPDDPDEAVRAMGPAVSELATMPEVTLIPYAVAGRNARAIRHHMDQVRPIDLEGGRYDALTTWQYSTRWGGGRGRCDPRTSEARVDVAVRLPQLTEGHRLRRSDRGRWNRYFAALVGHETRHAKLAVEGAQVMQAEMRQAESCADLAKIRDSRAEAVALENHRFDQSTDHGRREGAVFP